MARKTKNRDSVFNFLIFNLLPRFHFYPSSRPPFPLPSFCAFRPSLFPSLFPSRPPSFLPAFLLSCLPSFLHSFQSVQFRLLPFPSPSFPSLFSSPSFPFSSPSLPFLASFPSFPSFFSFLPSFLYCVIVHIHIHIHIYIHICIFIHMYTL